MSIEKNNATKQWRLPAEWEPQSMVQLTWPHAKTDWAPMLDEITETYEEMAREISKREPLLIVAPKNVGSTVNYQLSTINLNDTWARDHGFITLVNDQGDARLLDFCFKRSVTYGENFIVSCIFCKVSEKSGKQQINFGFSRTYSYLRRIIVMEKWTYKNY